MPAGDGDPGQCGMWRNRNDSVESPDGGIDAYELWLKGVTS
jgi:hypothetical protein